MKKLGVLCGWLMLLSLVSLAFGQKVKVGYDKSVDFSRYKTFTREEPVSQPTRPILYAMMTGAIDDELRLKSFQKMDAGGDLLLICTGGADLGIANSAGTPILNNFTGPPLDINANMWTGAGGPAMLTAHYVAKGTLMLTFADQKTHKIVWSGTVTQNLSLDDKKGSMKKVDKAIVKLLSEFPPKAK
jgi:hypothetical protein